VAVCCSEWQCVAVSGSVLQWVAVCCSEWQCVAAWSRVTYANAFVANYLDSQEHLYIHQYTCTHICAYEMAPTKEASVLHFMRWFRVCCSMLQYVAVCSAEVQYDAVWRSVAQCVAVSCCVLQCVAVRTRRVRRVWDGDNLPIWLWSVCCSVLWWGAVWRSVEQYGLVGSGGFEMVTISRFDCGV